MFEGARVLAAHHVDLGEGVVDRVLEPAPRLRGGIQAGVEIGDGRVELADLAAGGPADPVGEPARRRAVQDLTGQADHHVPRFVAVGLEDQLRGSVHVLGRGSCQEPLQGGGAVSGAVEAELGPYAVAQQRQHRGLLVVQPEARGRRWVFLLASEHGRGHPPHGARAGGLAAGGAVEQQVGQLQHGGVGVGIAQQAQQIGGSQRHRGGRLLHVGADPGLPALGLSQGEQGPGLEFAGLDLVGVQGEGLLGALQCQLVVPPGQVILGLLAASQVDLGEGVVDGVLEVFVVLRGQLVTGLQVGQRAVEIAELGARCAADPQGIGGVRGALQQLRRELDHGAVVAAVVGLVQQLGGVRQLPLVGGGEGRREHGLAQLVRAGTEQAADTHPHERDHVGGPAPQPGRRVVAALPGEQGAGHLACWRQLGRGGLEDQLEQPVGVPEGGVEAPGLAQGVQQVGQVQAHAGVHDRQAGLENRAALVDAPEGHQGARLHLEARDLARLELQRLLGVFERAKVRALLGQGLAAQGVDLGEGVVDGVQEAAPGRGRGLEAGLEVFQRLVELAELAPGRAADPQAVGARRLTLEHPAGQLDHEVPVLAAVGLEDQLGGLVQIRVGRPRQGVPQAGRGPVGLVQGVQGSRAGADQGEQHAALAAQGAALLGDLGGLAAARTQRGAGDPA